MRHCVAGRKLNRTSEHRKALRRNMAQSLFEHGQIRTTISKAKDLRPFVERLITLARQARGGSLAARQRLTAIMGDRAIVPADNQEEYEDMSNAARNRALRSRSGRRYRLGQARGGQKFTAMSVVHHLINNIAAEFEERQGGYTRIIKLGRVHKGDSTSLAVLQLVGEEESPGTVTRPEAGARQRRAQRRYAAAAEAMKKRGRSSTTEPESGKEEEPSEEVAQGELTARDETAAEEKASAEEAAADEEPNEETPAE
ncbi:MAG: 50S ribosomal protein L17 [Planctomycetota bacterium]|nr:MAG: 50S ribosomal protein L17 [Planctomycetota bacterium]